MTSTGKIARLSKAVRDELNQRLDDGQTAEDILPWLNRLRECKKVLAEKFGGRPITRQNLSQWKCGGYQAWLRLQQAREQVQSLIEQAEDLEKDSGDPSIADRIAAVLSAQLLATIQQLDTIKDPKERWLQTKDVLHEVSRLRREDHHARRTRLAEEQWDDKRTRQQEQDEKDRKKAERGRLIAWAFSWFTRKDEIESHGGGEVGRRWADWFHRVRNGLPLPNWWPGPWADRDFGPDGTDWSNVRFPDEPKASSPVAPQSVAKAETSNAPNPSSLTPPAPVKVNQTKSKVGQASRLSPSPPQTIEPTSPPEHGHPVSQKLSSEDGSFPRQHSTPAAAAETSSEKSERISTSASSDSQKPIASNESPS